VWSFAATSAVILLYLIPWTTASDPVDYGVELAGEATAHQLQELVTLVDAIAEIPNSLRGITSGSAESKLPAECHSVACEYPLLSLQRALAT